MSDTYDVVLLIEQELTEADAAQVRSLHEAIEDPVVYHVLLPLEDAAARIEAAMGSLAAGEVMASPAMVMSDVDLDAVRRDCEERSDGELAHTLAALAAAGATATGQVVTEPPIDALAATIDLGDRLGRQPVRAVGYRIEPGCAAKWQLLCDQLAPRYLRPMVWHDAASESAWDLTRELDKVPETFVSPVVDDVAATTTVQQVLEAADDGHR